MTAPTKDLQTSNKAAALRILLYMLIFAGILTIWGKGLQWLLSNRFVPNIYAGAQTISRDWTVPVSTPRLLLSVGLLGAMILYRKRIVGWIPAAGRTLLLPLPFYLLLTSDWRSSLAILAAGIVLCVVPARYTSRVSPLLWPLLYVSLLTRSIAATVGVAVLLVWLLVFDVWMKEFFEPVWRLQDRLPKQLLRGLLAIRLVVGLSIPFVLPYSLGMKPIGYTLPFSSVTFVLSGQTWLLTAVSLCASMFVIKSPKHMDRS